MRCLIAVFIAISAVLAIIQYRSSVTFIAQLMGVSWGALAGAFLAPFLYGLYWKRTTTAACWVSFLFSTAVMLADISPLKAHFPALLVSPINCGASCMIAGLIIVPVVSLFNTGDLPEYASYAPQDCPLCRQGLEVDAVVDKYGYSKL